MKRVLTSVVFLIFTICLTSFAFAANQTPIRIATGGERGLYYGVAGKNIAMHLGRIPIDLLITSGSVENIDLLRKGEADLAIIQYDSLLTEGKDMNLIVITPLYDEYVHLITRRDDNIDSIKDFKPETTKLAIGIDGSGTSVTWKGFCSLDESYKKIATLPIGGSRALSELAQGNIQGVLIVGGLKMGDVVRADADGKTYKMAAVDDWDFDNAKYNNQKIYEFKSLSSHTYPGLIRGGFISANKIETIALKSVLVTTTKWADENPKLYDRVFDAANSAKPNIEQELDARRKGK